MRPSPSSAAASCLSLCGLRTRTRRTVDFLKTEIVSNLTLSSSRTPQSESGPLYSPTMVQSQSRTGGTTGCCWWFLSIKLKLCVKREVWQSAGSIGSQRNVLLSVNNLLLTGTETFDPNQKQTGPSRWTASPFNSNLNCGMRQNQNLLEVYRSRVTSCRDATHSCADTWWPTGLPAPTGLQ